MIPDNPGLFIFTMKVQRNNEMPTNISFSWLFVQNDVCAEVNTRLQFSHSTTLKGKYDVMMCTCFSILGFLTSLIWS